MTRRQAVIAGIADATLREGKFAEPASPLQAQARCAVAALRSSGLTLGDVDGLFVTGMWGIPGVGQLPSITLAEYLGIQPVVHDGTNIGGNSFQLFLARAIDAVERGDCDAALICYGSAQRSELSRSLAGRPATLTMQFETPWGLPTPVGGYALAAARHFHDYGSSRHDLAEIAVAARQWATLNPAATKRDPITVDDVLAAPQIASPLGLLDCCLVTDGAGVIVVTTEEQAKSAGVTPVYLRGHGHAGTHWTIAAMPDLSRLVPAETAARRAFEMAGISHDQIDVTEVYDSFTITVLMTLEALGFCKPGEGKDFIANGRIAPGGDFPLNTNGGGLSYAHPGMYGIFLLIEAVRQLRGEAEPARQIQGARTALVHGTGGTLSSGATCILTTN